MEDKRARKTQVRSSIYLLRGFVFVSLFWLMLPSGLLGGNLPINKIPTFTKAPIKPPPIADLTVTDITFTPKSTSATVTITVKNVGTAKSSKTKLSAVLIWQRGKLSKSWDLKPINPGKTTKIRWFVKPGAGTNTVKAAVQDPVNKKNNTLEKSFSFFPPVLSKKAPVLKKHIPPRMVGKQRPKKEASPLLKPEIGKHLKKQALLKATKRPSGISTYGGSAAMFISPRRDEVVPIGESYQVKWGLPEEMQTPDTRLDLELISDESPPLIPNLTLARDMSPDTRTYQMDTRLLPPGRYKLRLDIRRPGVSIHTIHTYFSLDRPRLRVTRGFINDSLVGSQCYEVGNSYTIKIEIENKGCDASRPFEAKIGAYVQGPEVQDEYLIKEKTFVINSLTRNSKTYVSMTFPIVSPRWHIIKVELDSAHQYSSSPEVEKFFLLSCKRPDLIVTVDRIKDKNLFDEVTFRVRVKNVGFSPVTENTRVKLTIQRTENHYFTVPPLDVGQEWTDTFSKRFYTTGIKRYSACVDVDDTITESDETNNFTAGRFQVFTHTEPMPKDNPRPPELILKEIYGIPETQTIDSSARFQPSLVLQCYSPDHVPCEFELKRLVEVFNYYPIAIFPPEVARYPYTVHFFSLYPGEVLRLDYGELGGHQLSRKAFLKATSESSWLNYRLEVWLSHLGVSKRKTLFERRYRVAKSQKVTSDVASVMINKQSSLFGLKRENPHPLTIISPTKNKVWTKGRTYQVAWIGEARGPYTLSLIFPDRPEQPLKLPNISGHSFDFSVRHEVPDGTYRILVEGQDGWGMSEPFQIRSPMPPKLKIKAGSISYEISKCQAKPYRVKVNLVIENEGGYQDQPFPVRFTFLRGREVVEHEEFSAGPLLDNKELSLEKIFNLKAGGRYDITIHVGQKSSKGPSETTFEKRGYLIKSLPDLRIAYRQEGDRLKFIVKNIGDGIANATHLSLKYKPKVLPPSGLYSASRWHKDGDFLVHDPILVKAIGAGRWVEIDGPSFPVPIEGGEVFYVTINPGREIEELCGSNNTVYGTLTSSPSSETPPSERMFQVENRTPRSVEVQVSRQNRHPPVRVPFDFTLRNGSSLQTTPPMEVVLIVRQGQQENSYSYYVPPLLTSAMGVSDEFHLTRTLSFPSNGGDISYRLWIPGEGGGTVLTEGVVEVIPMVSR